MLQRQSMEPTKLIWVNNPFSVPGLEAGHINPKILMPPTTIYLRSICRPAEEGKKDQQRTNHASRGIK